MHAAIGVKRDVKEDGPSAVACIREGFKTTDEAEEFIAGYEKTAECKKLYIEVHRQSYEGEKWEPCGGFCYVYARRVLIRSYDDLKKRGGEEPRVVQGICNLASPDSKPVRGGHAWVECGRFVVDCGSYLCAPERQSKVLQGRTSRGD